VLRTLKTRSTPKWRSRLNPIDAEMAIDAQPRSTPKWQSTVNRDRRRNGNRRSTTIDAEMAIDA
jgi:hypothetical protein